MVWFYLVPVQRGLDIRTALHYLLFVRMIGGVLKYGCFGEGRRQLQTLWGAVSAKNRKPPRAPHRSPCPGGKHHHHHAQHHTTTHGYYSFY